MCSTYIKRENLYKNTQYNYYKQVHIIKIVIHIEFNIRILKILKETDKQLDDQGNPRSRQFTSWLNVYKYKLVFNLMITKLTWKLITNEIIVFAPFISLLSSEALTVDYL